MSTSQGHAIDVRNAVKKYGDFVALKSISLAIEDNEFFTLLGPSGCGKTTLLRMIAGFEDVTEGEIYLFGQEIETLPPNKRPVNTVFQNYALFPHMTVMENVGFGLEMLGKSKSEAQKRAGEILEMVQLSQFSQRKPSQLSGGQQQRVALARALAPQPKVLLLDEPLSALDPFLRVRMRTELKKLQRELGITFVHVTHGQDEALALADEIVVMNAAKIEQAGKTRAVFDAPATAFVARFLGSHNVVSMPGGMVAIRSDALRITPAGTARLPGTITSIEYQGTHVALTAAVPGDQEVTAVLSDRDFFDDPKNPGEAIGLDWEAEAAHALAG